MESTITLYLNCLCSVQLLEEEQLRRELVSTSSSLEEGNLTIEDKSRNAHVFIWVRLMYKSQGSSP